MNETNPASAESGPERLVMCTTSPDLHEHRRIKKLMEDAGIKVIVVDQSRTTVVLTARDIELPRMAPINENQNFGRRRKKGGFRKFT